MNIYHALSLMRYLSNESSRNVGDNLYAYILRGGLLVEPLDLISDPSLEPWLRPTYVVGRFLYIL